MNKFFQKIVGDFFYFGLRCKGRYIFLVFFIKRLGVKSVFGMSSNLLFEIVQVYSDDDVCCAVILFLKCFFERLRDECWSSNGVEKGYEIYRGYCFFLILYGFVFGVLKLRSNLNIYVLLSLFEVDVDSIFFMFFFILIGVGVEVSLVYSESSCLKTVIDMEQKVVVLVLLFKVFRSFVFFEGDIDLSYSFSVLTDQCMVE